VKIRKRNEIEKFHPLILERLNKAAARNRRFTSQAVTRGSSDLFFPSAETICITLK